MKRTTPATRLAFALVLTMLVGACATPPEPAPAPVEPPKPVAPAPAPVVPPPPPPPPAPPPPTAASELAAGIKSYDDGDYKMAEQKLQSALDMGLATPEERARAHKYRAFMVCVTGREKACRDEFRLALTADPAFALAPAEATHPVWPKVVASVKAEMARAARKPPAKTAPPAKAAPAKSAPAKPAPAANAAPGAAAK